MQDYSTFFTNPKHTNHKKYEALRAVFVDKKTSSDVAREFGYSLLSVQTFRRDFIQAMRDSSMESALFFKNPEPGRKEKPEMELIKNEIILLRKQYHSILDIQSILNSKGCNVSHDYVHSVLKADGFAKLPKRTELERINMRAKNIEAPKSNPIQWEDDDGKYFCSERGIGILPFVPIMSELHVDKWIDEAGYPETQILNRYQSIFSFLALKLSGHRRYHHDDLWAMDRAFGLCAGLNVLPKTTTLSSYSCRVSREMNRKFLDSMAKEFQKLNLISDAWNLDFTAIPHWGDESILENNWSGKRNKALKSVLAALVQDPDSGVFGYSNAELKKNDQSNFVLEFVDFWRQDQRKISCLIFDSKFTIYENLERLDKDEIKFITLRRRGPKLIEEVNKISEEQWQTIIIEGLSRKRRKVKIHESEIQLNKFIARIFRQIIVKDNGHEKPSFFITNEREKTASQIVRQYGKRWNVEKGISEQIEFFHLNSLSSSIVVKVDFDLTMSITAHNIYRLIAQELNGFENEAAFSLYNKFFSNGGQFKITPTEIQVDLKKKRHLPVLMEVLKKHSNTQVPWLRNRKFKFCAWSKS